MSTRCLIPRTRRRSSAQHLRARRACRTDVGPIYWTNLSQRLIEKSTAGKKPSQCLTHKYTLVHGSDSREPLPLACVAKWRGRRPAGPSSRLTRLPLIWVETVSDRVVSGNVPVCGCLCLTVITPRAAKHGTHKAIGVWRQGSVDQSRRQRFKRRTVAPTLSNPTIHWVFWDPTPAVCGAVPRRRRSHRVAG